MLLGDKLRVCTPTGVASYDIEGLTLHSLLSLPTKGDFKDLDRRKLNEMQQSLSQIRYLIIDEMSMVGRKTYGQINKCLSQIFHYKAHELLGGCSCILFGDFGQLPPVLDLPLYTTVSRNELSDLRSSTYHSFDCAVVLDQIMCQCGHSPEQVFSWYSIKNGNTTISDWNHLIQQMSCLDDVTPLKMLCIFFLQLCLLQNTISVNCTTSIDQLLQ